MTAYATKALATSAAKKYTDYSAKGKSKICDFTVARAGAGNDEMLARWHCGTKKNGKLTSLTHIDHFDVDWEYYDTKSNRWIQANNGAKQVSPTSKASGYYEDTYTLPAANTVNMVRVRVHAVAKTHKVTTSYTVTENGKTKRKTVTANPVYWKTSWSGYKTFDFSLKARPAIPDAPSVEAVYSDAPADLGDLKGVKVSWKGFERPTTCIVIDRYADGADYDGGKRIAPKGGHVPAEVFQNPDGGSYFDTAVKDGHYYRYALRAHNYDVNGDIAWSLPPDEMTASQFELSLSEAVEARPLPVKNLVASLESLSDGKAAVLLEWTNAGFVGDKFVVTYAHTADDLFTPGARWEHEPDLPFVGDGARMSCVVTGLDAGGDYYFFVEVENQAGRSSPSNFARCITGAPPEPPTPYAGESAYISGDEATLAWLHNPVDGSEQSVAEVTVTYSGAVERVDVIVLGSASSTVVDLGGLPDGTTVSWRVRTRGAHPAYSGLSEPVEFTVYAPPSCYIEAYEGSDGGRRVYDGGALSALPLVCALTPGGTVSQSPVEWDFEIAAAEDFHYVAADGEWAFMRAGSVMARARADANSEGFDSTRQLVEVAARDAVFLNGASYEIRASVLMNTGLRSETSVLPFTCDFEYDMPDPTASATFNGEDYTMMVLPECRDEDGELVGGITLDVWRIGYDGELVPVAEDVPNDGTLVTDPHPSFGECAYRVVANDPETDQCSVHDTLPTPTPVYGILIQWNEDHVAGVDPDTGEVAYQADQVMLPYDITVNESSEPDRALVEPIGRENPVPFFGTQLGIGGKLTCDLVKGDDADLLAGLRALHRHQGTVYVRETSGMGYRAVASVEFGRSYNSAKVPVTIEVRKVDDR